MVGREALRSLHDLVDHRAAEQRERAGAHGRAGIVLAGAIMAMATHSSRQKPSAVDRRGFQRALRMQVNGAHPAGQVGERVLGARRPMTSV
jgi:hypothetical protein